jgi:hypothetical protein
VLAVWSCPQELIPYDRGEPQRFKFEDPGDGKLQLGGNQGRRELVKSSVLSLGGLAPCQPLAFAFWVSLASQKHSQGG